jgi:hypothetical protein
LKKLTQILNRFNDSLIFEAEVEADSESVRLGLVLKLAYKSGAYLSGADLRGADLGGADLRGAYLSGAYLGGADLRGADLSGADLRGAYLSGAYLGGADLSGAYLGGADLRGAYLSGAYVRGAAKLIGARPILQIGPIGSRRAYLSAFVTDKGLYFQTGCFFGDLAAFRAAIAKTHDSNPHATEYEAALHLILRHRELWGQEAAAAEPAETQEASA